jgi:hypothetical protein
MKRIAFALVALAVGAAAADKMTGREWQHWDTLARLTYIRAVKDTLTALEGDTIMPVDLPKTASHDEREKSIGALEAVFDGVFTYFPMAEVTVSDLCDAVTRFYETPENRLIPITVAMEIVTLRFNGVPESCISEHTRQARQAVAGKTERQAREDAQRACKAASTAPAPAPPAASPR